MEKFYLNKITNSDEFEDANDYLNGLLDKGFNNLTLEEDEELCRVSAMIAEWENDLLETEYYEE